MHTISVIGLGYIGLPTASLLATKGFRVSGVDINSNIVNTINRGSIHFHEPDLDVLVRSAVSSGNLKAYSEPIKSDIFIIAVPTPFTANHSPDLSYVDEASKAISKVLKGGDLIILESTVPVGTTERIGKLIEELREDLSIFDTEKSGDKNLENCVYLAHCPERVLPGRILKELIENDRIIGGINSSSSQKAAEFYKCFVHAKTIITNSRTAELIKLSENAFRDVNIAFANELSIICDKLEINVWDLIEFANLHPRVNILKPGAGVGGHCIAVDPWFIIDSAPDISKILVSSREVNDYKPNFVTKKIENEISNLIKKNGSSIKIGCFGLAFKADVDDLRNSPSVNIVKQLAEGKQDILVIEPHIKELPSELAKLTNVQLVTQEEGIIQSDLIVFLQAHSSFKQINDKSLLDRSVLDFCGVSREIKR